MWSIFSCVCWPFVCFLWRNVCLCLLPITQKLLNAPWHILEMSGRSWTVLVIAALITGFGAFYFLTLASKILLAGELATISYQETIMASILGFLLFHEHLTLLQFVGGALIIAGGLSQVIFSTRGAEKKKKVEPLPAEPALEPSKG